jgi:hypothetical protein
MNNLLKGRNAPKLDHLKGRNAPKFERLGGAKCSKFGPFVERGAKCFNTGPLSDEAKCSNYPGLKTASPRDAKAEGVGWMMRCSGEVGDRKDS